MFLSEMSKCKECKSEPAWSAFNDKAHYICKNASVWGMSKYDKKHLKMCYNNKHFYSIEEWQNYNKKE